jgi:hypothetical protein
MKLPHLMLRTKRRPVMKKPGYHRKINTILILILLACGIALLGVRSHWVAARTHPAAMAATVAQGCTLNCSATVPATGTINTAVQFTGDATPSGCSTTPTFNWDFGDGSPNSSQQNPTYTYTTAGTYSWTLTSTVGSGGLIIDTIAGWAG